MLALYITSSLLSALFFALRSYSLAICCLFHHNWPLVFLSYSVKCTQPCQSDSSSERVWWFLPSLLPLLCNVFLSINSNERLSQTSWSSSPMSTDALRQPQLTYCSSTEMPPSLLLPGGIYLHVGVLNSISFSHFLYV